MHIHQLQKKRKKKKEGKYLSKRNILKKLFLKERDFQKLCIFKGIYPKDFKEIPLKYRGKFCKNKVYYTDNDLKKLSHEKIIQDFRKIKLTLKKFKKYKLTLKDEEKCKHIIKKFPTYKLDHIIKERFPIFSYAIEQLSDALTTIISYSFLPTNDNCGIKNNYIKNCITLKDYFHYYIYKTKKLKKGYITVKGYFLQAEILQKKVTWLIPHIFTPYIDKSIDFNLISTFVEYYICLLKFVLFKLYKMDDLIYPPKEYEELKYEKLNHLAYDENFSPKGYISGDHLVQENSAPATAAPAAIAPAAIAPAAIAPAAVAPAAVAPSTAVESDQPEERTSKMDESSPKCENVTNEGKAPSMQNPCIKHDIIDENTVKELFKNHVFYIHGDMPLHVLSILILSCGGSIAWNSPYSPVKYESNYITHEILEKPVESKKLSKTSKKAKANKTAKSAHVIETGEENEYKYARNFVQPQYVFDCINRKQILPCEDYTVGKPLPVHLSPFIEDDNYKHFVRKEEYIINKMLSRHRKYDTDDHKKERDPNQGDSEKDNEHRQLGDDDEIDNNILQKQRHLAMRNQRELEDEDACDQSSVLPNESADVDEESFKIMKRKEDTQRQKITLSKKKRKLYGRIERAERRQKETLEKFINKAENRSGKKKVYQQGKKRKNKKWKKKESAPA
ncbi:pescadillo homolog, putative (PES) [Plasmodium ovale wallikeri]|uniref:Pescadillo homolog n=1 Tax=Plasmodium ovale wallikeri TaxID=864142 RepID=A0A1A8YTF8_PLAOA|nr:pescadillo homolog, putative (PES) [Plasmodium ovale wallikeri]SBT35342.1 pescadillo homolog, putative (PES) [Plasmodium ovale wallikeri]